jgi:1,4-dihydroxy-2-naphthoate polyprenyltransferase
MSAARAGGGAVRIWLMAARPRTLPAAVAPVLVGTAAAVQWAGELPRWGAFLAALAGSIFIQIGTNLANDYSDAKRGADSADRLGPVRVTSAGLVTPQRVMTATWIAFAIAVACGIYLTTVAGAVILVIGAFSIAAGVLYTGGPRPYGYAGLGEVFVFLFFGLVAVNGSYYVQVEELDALPLGLSIAVGFLATAILVVNNVRDLETDRRAGKMTLAVRMGRANAVNLYRLLVLGAFAVLPIALWGGEASMLPLIGLLALPLAIPPLRAMAERTDGPALNAALAATGTLLGAFSLLVTAGLLISA